jgi:hypothetical protein
MPTNRRRRVRGLIDRDVPAWAERLVNEGIAPLEGEDGSDEWFGWLFCSDEVPGLPSSDSPEGQRLWSDALKPAARHPARQHRARREGPTER